MEAPWAQPNAIENHFTEVREQDEYSSGAGRVSAPIPALRSPSRRSAPPGRPPSRWVARRSRAAVAPGVPQRAVASAGLAHLVPSLVAPIPKSWYNPVSAQARALLRDAGTRGALPVIRGGHVAAI